MGLLRHYVFLWKSFPRNLRCFFWFDLSYQLAVAVYALYFPRYLLALGHREDTLGALLATGTLCMALCATGAGLLSDRIGRRRSLIYGVTISKTAFLARGFLVSVPAMFGTYVIDGVFITLYSAAATPFIFENTGDEQRVHAFSLHGILLRVAGIAGNVIGGLLPTLLGAFAPHWDDLTLYRVIFGLAVCLAAFGISRLFLLTEVQSGPAPELRVAAGGGRISQKDLAFILKFVLTSALVAFGASNFLPFMNTYLIQTFDASPATVGLFLSSAQVAVIAGIALAPWLAQRMGLVKSIMVTRFLALPMFILMAVSTNLWMAAVTFALRNTLQQMSGPLTNTFVLSQLDRRTRATANGLLHTAENAVRALAMYTSGRVIIACGYPAVFMIAFVTYSLSACLFYSFFARGASTPAGAHPHKSGSRARTPLQTERR